MTKEPMQAFTARISKKTSREVRIYCIKNGLKLKAFTDLAFQHYLAAQKTEKLK